MFAGRSSCMVLKYACFLSWLSDNFVSYVLIGKWVIDFLLNLLVSGAPREHSTIFVPPLCLFFHHSFPSPSLHLVALSSCLSWMPFITPFIHLLSKVLFLAGDFKGHRARWMFLFWTVLGHCCRDYRSAKPLADITFSWPTRENRLPQLG